MLYIEQVKPHEDEKKLGVAGILRYLIFANGIYTFE